jgi:hypothetical protein
MFHWASGNFLGIFEIFRIFFVALLNYQAISRLFLSRRCFLKMKRNFLFPFLFRPIAASGPSLRSLPPPLDFFARPLKLPQVLRPQPSNLADSARFNPSDPHPGLSPLRPARSPSGPRQRFTPAAAGTPPESGASTPRGPGGTRQAVRPLFSLCASPWALAAPRPCAGRHRKATCAPRCLCWSRAERRRRWRWLRRFAATEHLQAKTTTPWALQGRAAHILLVPIAGRPLEHRRRAGTSRSPWPSAAGGIPVAPYTPNTGEHIHVILSSSSFNSVTHLSF